MSIEQATKKTLKTVKYSLASGAAWRWIQKGIVLIVFSLVVNHLATRDSFPGGASYRFPVEGFLMTIVISLFVGLIAELNFKFYKKKHFSSKVETSSIARFMISTLGYISVMYIVINCIVDLALGGHIQPYYLVIGLLITLLLCFILIALWYAQDLYILYKLSLRDAEITIDSGTKIKKLSYENIACFYSENKIVYTVQNDGSTIHTGFTLNELETKINGQLFFRANRQIIIHKDTIDLIEKIENGKLRIRLKSFIKNNGITQITISRYKRKAFLDWFQ